MVFAPAPPPWKPLPVSPLAARHESVACEREGGRGAVRGGATRGSAKDILTTFSGAEKMGWLA